MRRLLIVDTDAGIDDAMALCMAFDAHARGDIEVGRQNVENYQHAIPLCPELDNSIVMPLAAALYASPSWNLGRRNTVFG